MHTAIDMKSATLGAWRTAALVDERFRDEAEAKLRARFAADPNVQFRARRINSAHAMRIPPRTVSLGSVLDFTTCLGDVRTRWDLELEGWAMLTDVGAFSMRKGVPGLYLVKPRRESVASDEPQGDGVRDYQKWHARDPAEVLEMEVADECPYLIGDVTQIGYRSDKWNKRGVDVDYDHDMTEHGKMPPQAWADSPDLQNATAVIIRGGDMQITVDGID